MTQRRRPTSPTISQVADAAGVSRSTVSRVFSRPDNISEETIRRVRTVAEQLGYTPNATARALSTGRIHNIALLVPDIANPFFPPLIAAVQEEAERRDYCVFLGSSGESVERELRLVNRLASQVEGLVLVSSRLPDAQIVDIAARVPVVLVNRDVDGIPRVLIDSAQGAAEAVAYLAELGHRHVVYVSGPSLSWSNTQRRKAVRRAARAAGLRMQSIACSAPTFDAGRQAVDGIRASGSRAVVAFDDLVAQGVIAGLTDARCRVPADYSVIGCDDVLGAVTHPALTSVSNCTEEAGRIAYRLLMDFLASPVPADARYLLGTRLVVRQSTAAPSGKRR